MWSLSLVSRRPRRGAFEVISALMGGSTRWPLKLLLNTELRLIQWERLVVSVLLFMFPDKVLGT